MIDIQALGSSSAGNCYYVTDGTTPILLEAGLRYKDMQRALHYQISSVQGCLLTHEHGDHSKSVPDILRAGVTTYMSQGTMNAMQLQHHRVQPVQARVPFTIGTWRILPFEVEHDVSEPMGFLLANQTGEKLLFVTDSFYIRYKFQGITHFLLECNYSKDILDENILEGRIPQVMRKRLLRSHFSLENVKEFFRVNDLSKTEEIWLLHLSDSNSDEERFKREIMELTGKRVIVA